MRLAITNSLYPPDCYGGAERSVRTLAEGLVKRGHSVDVFCLTDARRGPFVETANGVTIHRYPLANVYWPFTHTASVGVIRKAIWHAFDSRNYPASRKALQDISNGRFDLLHTNNLCGFSTSLLHTLRKASIPIVHTARDYYGICTKSTMFRNSNCSTQCLLCKAQARLKSLSTAPINTFVAISHHILKAYKRFGAIPFSADTRVVYNGIDLPAVAKRDLYDGGRALKIGFIGTLASAKGIEVLLEAASRLGKNATLHVAGKGKEEYVGQLRQAANGHPVEFLGQVEAGEFLGSIDVLAVPSLWHEPFGRVVVESYRRGTPVVAFRRGAMPELIRDEQTGWIVDDTTSEALTSCLKRLSEAPHRIHNASEGAFAAGMELGVEQMISGYNEVYESTVRQFAASDKKVKA